MRTYNNRIKSSEAREASLKSDLDTQTKKYEKRTGYQDQKRG
jgi:hypothetical protein